jgi:hypothetical protein
MVLVTIPAFGQECQSGDRNPSRYCFALDVIQTLQIAHNAYALYGDTIGVGLAPCIAGEAADFIYRAKQQEQAFNHALLVLRPSAASSDSSIRLSRQGLVFAYSTNLKVTLDIQRHCRLLADGLLPPGFTRPSQVADSAAKTRLALHNASEPVLISVAEVSDGLADIDPSTNRLTILRLSAEQRETLLTMLANAFGPDVRTFDRNNPKMLSTDFATAAATFYNFLSDKAWRLQPTPRQ